MMVPMSHTPYDNPGGDPADHPDRPTADGLEAPYGLEAPDTAGPPEAVAATETTEPGERPGWKRDTTLFLGGQTISLFGSMLVQFAIMWHLTLETKSGVVLTLASVFGFLPQAVVSVFGGVWADRLDRKKLVIGADAAIAVTTLALALLLAAGAEALWLIYAALAIRSVGAGIQMPAVSALIPQIVPASKLMRVNGLNGTIQSAMMLVAPAVAAWVYSAFSLVAIFYIDVVTAVIGIGLLAVLKVPRMVRADGGETGYFDDLVGGLRYIGSHAFVRWVLALYAIVFLLIVAPSYLTPLMIVRTFGEEKWMLAGNELAFSVGMVVGGVVIAAWGGLRNRITMLVGSSLVFGALSIGLGLSTNLWVFFGFMALLGLAVPFFSTPSMTVLQETVEPDKQGRVFGFVGIVMAVAMPLGMAIFGPLADRFSVESLLVVAGLALFAVVGIALALPSGRRAMRAAGEHAAAGAERTGAEAAGAERSGAAAETVAADRR